MPVGEPRRRAYKSYYLSYVMMRMGLAKVARHKVVNTVGESREFTRVSTIKSALVRRR